MTLAVIDKGSIAGKDGGHEDPSLYDYSRGHPSSLVTDLTSFPYSSLKPLVKLISFYSKRATFAR